MAGHLGVPSNAGCQPRRSACPPDRTVHRRRCARADDRRSACGSTCSASRRRRRRRRVDRRAAGARLRRRRRCDARLVRARRPPAHPARAAAAPIELWELLAGTAAIDVAAARILEPHLDALAILEQAGTDLDRDVDPWRLTDVGATPDTSWGVLRGGGAGCSAARGPATVPAWTLHGTKAWCSLAAHVSHALVTAFVDDSRAASVRRRHARAAVSGRTPVRGMPGDSRTS